MIEELENMIVYMAIQEVSFNKQSKFTAGNHAYTYKIAEAGKKQLQRGVPTTLGYYLGNAKQQGTAINIKEYCLTTVTNGATLIDAGLTLLTSMLDYVTKEENKTRFNNVCFICQHPIFEKLINADLQKLAEKEYVVGKTTLSANEVTLLEKLQLQYAEWKALGKKILFDVDSSVEGGLGNKLSSKQAGLAKIETTPTGKKRIIFEVLTKKEYEEPETDFNKIVTAGRWYFNTGPGTHFYDDYHGYRGYNFGRVEPDKKYYGKLTPDVTFSTLFSKKPVEMLDKLFEYTKKNIPNPNEYLSAGILKAVVSKDVARIIDTFPGIKAGKDINIPFESAGREEPTLIEMIDPPLLSYHIRNNIAKVSHLFDLFIERDETNKKGWTQFHDITSLFIIEETNKKGVVKRKLHPDFKANMTVIPVPVVHRNAAKPVKLNLSLGYDLPERNNINAVLAEDVKIWVAADTQNDKAIRYYCVIEAPDWVYIQTSAVANLRVLSIKELGQEPPKKTEVKK